MKIYRLAAPRSLNWSQVDWYKSNDELEQELGRSKTQIGRMRREFAPETIRTRYSLGDWSQVDWSKSNAELANETGMSIARVRQVRNKLAPETLPDSLDWSQVDWSKSNIELMNELGRSKAPVVVNRKKFAPETISNYHMPKGIDWSDVDWHAERGVDIANRKNVSEGNVSYMRSMLAPETIQQEFGANRLTDWSSLDWSKSNPELAEIIKNQALIENNGEIPFSVNNLPLMVGKYRRIYAPETQFSSYDWNQVDWSKSTRELMNETGMSQSQIEKKRKSVGF